jgi:hypothetical protein
MAIAYALTGFVSGIAQAQSKAEAPTITVYQDPT